MRTNNDFIIKAELSWHFSENNTLSSFTDCLKKYSTQLTALSLFNIGCLLPTDMNKLIQLLNDDYPNIRTLRAKNCSLFAEIIGKYSRTIKELHMDDSPLTDTDFLCLANNKFIERLTVGSSTVEYRKTLSIEILKAFGNSKNLKHLRLAYHKVSEEGAKLLASNDNSITSFDLFLCEISEEGQRAFLSKHNLFNMSSFTAGSGNSKVEQKILFNKLYPYLSVLMHFKNSKVKGISVNEDILLFIAAFAVQLLDLEQFRTESCLKKPVYENPEARFPKLSKESKNDLNNHVVKLKERLKGYLFTGTVPPYEAPVEHNDVPQIVPDLPLVLAPTPVLVPEAVQRTIGSDFNCLDMYGFYSADYVEMDSQKIFAALNQNLNDYINTKEAKGIEDWGYNSAKVLLATLSSNADHNFKMFIVDAYLSKGTSKYLKGENLLLEFQHACRGYGQEIFLLAKEYANNRQLGDLRDTQDIFLRYLKDSPKNQGSIIIEEAFLRNLKGDQEKCSIQ